MAGFESSGSVIQAETAEAIRPSSEKDGRVASFCNQWRQLPESLLDRLVVHAIDGDHLGRR